MNLTRFSSSSSSFIGNVLSCHFSRNCRRSSFFFSSFIDRVFFILGQRTLLLILVHHLHTRDFLVLVLLLFSFVLVFLTRTHIYTTKFILLYSFVFQLILLSITTKKRGKKKVLITFLLSTNTIITQCSFSLLMLFLSHRKLI
jgi:hypothetical protein